MPILVLAARMCPEGVEATLFATLMSLLNGGGSVGNVLGAALTAALGVTSTNFDNLFLLVRMQCMCVCMFGFVPRGLCMFVEEWLGHAILLCFLSHSQVRTSCEPWYACILQSVGACVCICVSLVPCF